MQNALQDENWKIIFLSYQLSGDICYFPHGGEGFGNELFKLLREVYETFDRNQNLCMKNYSLLFVRSNQWSVQGRYVVSTMKILTKSLRIHINCLVDVF